MKHTEENMYSSSTPNDAAPQNSSARFRAQTRALDVFDIVAETDRRGRILSVNDRFVEISKYSRDELIGQDHRILNSGFHPKEFFKNMWSVIHRGEVWSGEIRNRAKDGSIYWVSTVITPILSDNQFIEGFLSIRRDITKEKLALEQLRESELRIRELLDQVSFLAVGLNLHGYITFANRFLCKISGYLPHELLGRDWISHLIAPEDRGRVTDFISRALTEQTENLAVEFNLLTKDGAVKAVLWTHTLFRNSNGDIVGLTALGEDITEKKANQKQLKELHEQTERRKEEVIGFVSHELRSPLMTIQMSVDRIQEQKLSDKIQTDLHLILDQVKRIAKISKDLMQSVIYHSGELVFKISSFELNALLSHIVARFEREAEIRHCRLRLELGDAPIWIEGDPDRLDQVFSNLISNAIKYSKTAGNNILVRAVGLKEYILVEVSDEGLGIPEESLPSIFESFSRGANVSKTGQQGFGLGLKIAKDIIERHHGEIRVESKLGVGTQFFVTLPL